VIRQELAAAPFAAAGAAALAEAVVEARAANTAVTAAAAVKNADLVMDRLPRSPSTSGTYTRFKGHAYQHFDSFFTKRAARTTVQADEA
jgi:hypothetical protein